MTNYVCMFILAFEKEIKYLRELLYRLVIVLITFRILKTNVYCVAPEPMELCMASYQFLLLFSQDNEHMELTVFFFFQNP